MLLNKTGIKAKSIILLSGGLDSTVSATIAKRRSNPLFALTFDYGQRAAAMEILASQKVCRALKIRHKVVKLPWFREFKRLIMLAGKKAVRPEDFNSKKVWIPNRNGLFINIAACYAEYFNARLIITGFNREEAREFPDNRVEFMESINITLKYSTLKRVRVISYVAKFTKMEIYELGLKYRAPLKYVYWCYLGKKRPCGRCASCRKVKGLNLRYGGTVVQSG